MEKESIAKAEEMLKAECSIKGFIESRVGCAIGAHTGHGIIGIVLFHRKNVNSLNIKNNRQAAGYSLSQYYIFCLFTLIFILYLSSLHNNFLTAIKQLVKKGLIRLETKEDNQREKKILLTKEGEDFIRNHIDGMIQLEKKAWDMMRNEEQEQLIALSQRYNDLLESELERS